MDITLSHQKQKYYGVDREGNFFEETLTEEEAVRFIGIHATAVLFMDEREREDWVKNI